MNTTRFVEANLFIVTFADGYTIERLSIESAINSAMIGSNPKELVRIHNEFGSMTVTF